MPKGSGVVLHVGVTQSDDDVVCSMPFLFIGLMVKIVNLRAEGKNSQQQAKSKAWSNNNILYTVCVCSMTIRG